MIIRFAGKAPGGECAAGARLVFHHNIAPEPVPHGGRDQPRHDIRGAPGREGANQTQILVRPSGCLGAQRGGSKQPGSGSDGGAACDAVHLV